MEWRPQKEGIATRTDKNLFTALQMEWRPQKEGIATNLLKLISFFPPKMEWRPQKEGIATPNYFSISFYFHFDGMETSKRRDCDLRSPKKDSLFRDPMEWRPQKEGIATNLFLQGSSPRLWMEWRPQKEGIATCLLLKSANFTGMEWRPQKEGIATVKKLHPGRTFFRWNGDLKKKGLRLLEREETLTGPKDGMETSKRRDCDTTGSPEMAFSCLDGMETSKRRDCDGYR